MQIGVLELLGDIALIVILINDVIHQLHGLVVALVQLFGVAIAVEISHKRIFIALDLVLEPTGKRTGLRAELLSVAVQIFLELFLGILAQAHTLVFCQLFDGTILLCLIQAAFLDAAKDFIACHGLNIHAKGVFIVHQIIDNVCCQLAGVYILSVNGCHNRCIVLRAAAGHCRQHADTEDTSHEHGK